MKASEVLIVCQQPVYVLTAFRYNLIEIINGPKISLHHQDKNHRPINFQSSATLALVFIQEEWICFPLPTYSYIKLSLFLTPKDTGQQDYNIATYVCIEFIKVAVK